MTTFFNSIHCAGNFHCGRCRNQAGGRAWRQGIVDAFDDVTEVDFPCPMGYEWGSNHAKPKKKVTYTADGRVLVNGVECKPCTKKRREEMA